MRLSIFYNLIIVLALAISCSSVKKGMKKVNNVADLSGINKKTAITVSNCDSILKKYTVPFTIPNPLSGDSGENLARFDPSHGNDILCKAVLLDEYSTEADIISKCRADSLSAEKSAEFRNKYISENIKEGMFRIRVEMESGFSEKSMDPKYWAMYIENTSGVMIEPADIKNSPVVVSRDSVYSEYRKIYFKRKLYKSSISLFFKNKTFFGNDILGDKTPFFILVISREQKYLARIAWKLNAEIKK
jgi:hypothetical protein